MNSIKQLIRNPLKTLCGILLVTAAVAVLCICLGQSMAAERIEAQLEDTYTTVALLTTKYQEGRDENGRKMILKDVPQEVSDWIEQSATEHPDIIESIDSRGLASAYIPEMVPDNPMSYYTTLYYASMMESRHSFAVEPFNAPYSQAMLVVTLEEIGEVMEAEDSGIQVKLSGKIDEVLQLAQGYTEPTGYTANLTLNLPNLESLDALNLTLGKSYCVYGRDYRDLDWMFRCELYHYGITNFDKGVEIPYIDPENIHPYNEESIETNRSRSQNGEYYVAYLEYERPSAIGIVKDIYQLTNWDMNDIHNISLTVADLEGNGNSSPMIVELRDTEDMLLEENALWSETLSNMRVNSQSFPVVGTDNLQSVASFAQENARIVEGRYFTEQETASVAKVCVISQILAEKNGLAVGDTLTFNYYNCDFDSSYQEFISNGNGIINPTAYYFDSNTPFADEGCSYTIVGLYTQDEIWKRPSEDLYAFTHNTIFVPKASVTGTMDYADQGFFLSIVLVNGQLDAFRDLVEEGNHYGLFAYYDQGYDMIRSSIHDYAEVAKRAVMIGLGVYSIILLLYLILYPGFQRPTLNTMSLLGTPRGKKKTHMMQSSLGILIPGTISGVILAVISWDKIVGDLKETAGVTLDLRMDFLDLAMIAVSQLLLATVLVFCVSTVMCAKENLMDRQSLLEKMKSIGKGRFNSWVVCLFTVTIALVLCVLNAANEAELQDFEEAYAAAPVTVTVVDYRAQKIDNDDAEDTEKIEDIWVDPTVVTVLTTDHMNISMGQYLTDIRMKCTMEDQVFNNRENFSIIGITSPRVANALTETYSGQINWYDGYSEDILLTGEAVCILPEELVRDDDPETEGQQFLLRFEFHTYSGFASRENLKVKFHEEYVTIVGTYTTKAATRDMYCPYELVQKFYKNYDPFSSGNCDHISATLIDNGMLDEFKAKADRLFLEFGAKETPPNKVPYALDINDDALVQLETTLENSMRINNLCTLLVFLLTAGAGFFLGFLMVRQRKREIILMRTLGKPNSYIYRDFAMEQMLWVLIGIAIGGGVFLWKPVGQLTLFALVYFLGLSGALILFLRSTLLTTIKEDN